MKSKNNKSHKQSDNQKADNQKVEKVEAISVVVEHSAKPVMSFHNEDFERVCIEALGIKSDICKRLGIKFDTLQRILEREVEKKQIYDNSVRYTAKDFVDSKLLQRIKGYNAPDLKVVNQELIAVEKHYPPNIEAMNTWYKINGFIVDRTENKNANMNLDLSSQLSELTAEQIKAKIRQFLD